MPTITSTANASVKAARKLLRRRQREATGEFLVESPQVLAAASDHLIRVFVADDADPDARAVAQAAAAAGAEMVPVTDAVLRTLTATTSPRGVVGVARLPEPSLDRIWPAARCVLLCCEVADPGNAGTIVRTADAAGADAVIFTADSVDPRNPKAVRASAGSLFHLPVVRGARPDDAVEAASRHGLRTVAADATGATPHTLADFTHPTLVVLGGEARGIAANLRERCDQVVRVDMFQGDRAGYAGHAESLNLAATAALMAFEVRRQQGQARHESEEGRQS
jgi:RNA methyltransferase, TrmH family